MVIPAVANISWKKVWRSVDAVRDRLLRVTRLLDEAGVAYAVIGGNAVASWVSAVDPSAQRFTQDVDLLIRRGDLEAARKALEPGGFIYRHAASIDMFLDGPEAGARDAVHIIFAGEKVRKEYEVPAPAVQESERTGEFQVLTLEALLRMKLTSNRRKDQVHVQDLISVGLIDATWPARFPKQLSERLQQLLDDPDG